MSSGKMPVVAMHLALWYVLHMSAISIPVCENYVGSVYVGGYGGLQPSCRTSVNCVQYCFLVVGTQVPSVLL